MYAFQLVNDKIRFQYLLSACQYANKETVELLINKFIQEGISLDLKDEDGRNVLHLTSSNGNKEIVGLLIEKYIEKKISLIQVDKNGKNALHLACEKGHKEVIELLIKGFINQEILWRENVLVKYNIY